MGDMADYALEMCGDFEALVMAYGDGDIADYEAYDYGIIDEYGAQPNSVSTKTCKHCGQPGLRWFKDKLGGWRLFNAFNEVHHCKQYKHL